MLRTRLAKLVEARARDLAEAPGGSTGLLIRCGARRYPSTKLTRACCTCSPSCERLAVAAEMAAVPNVRLADPTGEPIRPLPEPCLAGVARMLSALRPA